MMEEGCRIFTGSSFGEDGGQQGKDNDGSLYHLLEQARWPKGSDAQSSLRRERCGREAHLPLPEIGAT